MNKKMKKVKKGFTLVEMIVVIAIIGVLAMLITPSIMSYVNKSKINTNASIAKNIAMSAQAVQADLPVPEKTVTLISWQSATRDWTATGTSFSANLTEMIKIDNAATATITLNATSGAVDRVDYVAPGGTALGAAATITTANEGAAVWVR